MAAKAPRDFLHADVWCDGMIAGALAHSCQHGKGPHRIKVCIVQRDNSKTVYKSLVERVKVAVNPSKA